MCASRVMPAARRCRSWVAVRPSTRTSKPGRIVDALPEGEREGVWERG